MTTGAASNPNPGVAETIEVTATASIFPNPFDLFRFIDDVAGFDPESEADFLTFVRNLIPGLDDNFDSIDGVLGAAAELALSSGDFFGDGNQASHFLGDAISGVNLGILDPTLASGLSFDLTEADLRVFDLIGFDITFIPEPGTALCLAGLSVLLGRRRGRHAA